MTVMWRIQLQTSKK